MMALWPRQRKSDRMPPRNVADDSPREFRRRFDKCSNRYRCEEAQNSKHLSHTLLTPTMKYLSLFPLCLVLFIQHVQADLIPESPSTLAVTTPLSLAGSAYASFPNPETLSVTNVTKMSEEEMADFLRLQRQQRQTDPKAVFSDRNMTAIEYAIVKCRDCSSAAASKSGAVCFVVYDQKDQDQSLPLRQDLFTKHSHKKTMTKAQRDAKSACYISDSPFVYGRETLETTNRIDGQHSAVFVPLARRTKSRFWSKLFVDRQLFKKLPTAQPMTAEELLMDKARKVETDYVFSPSSFLQWMLHSSEVQISIKYKCSMMF